MEKKTVNVLGTEYTIEYREKADDPVLTDSDGYCDYSVKRIVIEIFHPEVGTMEDIESYSEKVLRHEIIHAFLYESGLDACSNWARNEEIVDWIALQFNKINEAIKSIE